MREQMSTGPGSRSQFADRADELLRKEQIPDEEHHIYVTGGQFRIAVLTFCGNQASAATGGFSPGFDGGFE